MTNDKLRELIREEIRKSFRESYTGILSGAEEAFNELVDEFNKNLPDLEHAAKLARSSMTGKEHDAVYTLTKLISVFYEASEALRKAGYKAKRPKG